MPAIRHLYNGSSPVAGPTAASARHPVEVAGPGGEPLRCTWLGFICSAGTHHVPGRLVKLFAIGVSNENGGPLTKWTTVAHHERVLGWAVPGTTGWGQFGVYGVVDAHGWPIVIKDKPPPGPRPKAEVKQLHERGSSAKD